jgi:hypothetical protein
MPSSRKILKEENTDKNIYYCRKCGKIKKSIDFYTTTDNFLDKNGKVSICKQCCNDMYNRFLENEKTIEKTIYRLCKILNVKYDEGAISLTKSRIENSKSDGKEIEGIFGIYKAILIAMQRKESDSPTIESGLCLEFVEPSKDSIFFTQIEETSKNIDYFKKIWGRVESIDEYDFLEEEYVRWVAPLGNVTHSEEVLIREICHYQNQIRKYRLEGNIAKVDEISKMMRSVMKDSMLTPALQSAANNGKNADTFGTWLKDIEQKTPAEWYMDQKKYKDIDGIGADIKDIIRSTKNFVTNSRDFNSAELESLESSPLDEE